MYIRSIVTIGGSVPTGPLGASGGGENSLVDEMVG